MSELKYITLREKPELIDTAAQWFNSKWGVPKEAQVVFLNVLHYNSTEL